MQIGHRQKASPENQERSFIESLGGLHDFSVGKKDGGGRHTLSHQLERADPVINHLERLSFKPEHIDFDTTRSDELRE